uniref:Fibrinogen C-terminal domain-containing protein n=1 Tax=Steinernema glaseri TaxID=37863 RepID=A0A1I8AR21_9BILA
MDKWRLMHQNLTDELTDQLQQRQTSISTKLTELNTSIAELSSKHTNLKFEVDHWKELVTSVKQNHKTQIEQIFLDVKGAKHGSDRALVVAEVVKKVQQELFTKLIDQSERMRDFDTQVTKYALKLTELQNDFLNATLFLHKTSVYDHSQDERFYALKGVVDSLGHKLNSNSENFEQLEEKIRDKVDMEVVRRMEKFMQHDAMKLSNLESQVKSIKSELQEAGSTVEQLKETLPNDCSLVEGSAPNVLIKPRTLKKALFTNCVDGWTVIQQRFGDNGTSMNRTFEEYSAGFGDIEKSFWLGNEAIDHLTRGDKTRAMFETWDLYGDYRVAVYDRFHVASKNANYRLTIGGFNEEKSNLTDAMSEHDGMQFSAYDKDLDKSSTHCGRYYLSGESIDDITFSYLFLISLSKYRPATCRQSLLIDD